VRKRWVQARSVHWQAGMSRVWSCTFREAAEAVTNELVPRSSLPQACSATTGGLEVGCRGEHSGTTDETVMKQARNWLISVWTGRNSGFDVASVNHGERKST
jgi:hypothetical protein